MIERLGRENLIYTTIDEHEFIIKTNENINKNIISIDIYIDVIKLYFFSAKDEKRIDNICL